MMWDRSVTSMTKISSELVRVSSGISSKRCPVAVKLFIAFRKCPHGNSIASLRRRKWIRQFKSWAELVVPFLQSYTPDGKSRTTIERESTKKKTSKYTNVMQSHRQFRCRVRPIDSKTSQRRRKIKAEPKKINEKKRQNDKNVATPHNIYHITASNILPTQTQPFTLTHRTNGRSIQWICIYEITHSHTRCICRANDIFAIVNITNFIVNIDNFHHFHFQFDLLTITTMPFIFSNISFSRISK